MRGSLHATGIPTRNGFAEVCQDLGIFLEEKNGDFSEQVDVATHPGKRGVAVDRGSNETWTHQT